MGTFLLLLFIFFIVIPLAKLSWRVFKMQRQWQKAQQQMRDAFRNAADGTDRDTAHRQSAQKRRPKKKIDPNVGEYVAFEEIRVTSSSSETTSADGTRTFKSESQVEDAVWEEIK